MAGDWIKMRTDLWTDPRIVRIMSATKADKAAVLGALFRLWSLADTHTIDGFLHSYSTEILDFEVGLEGFSAALQDKHVRWLKVTKRGISVPKFDDHNSKSAKRRAQDSVRKTSARQADKTGTREEKRREDTQKEEEEKAPSAEWLKKRGLSLEEWGKLNG